MQVYNQPGALTWTEACVADPAGARAFYGAVFGFTFQEVPDSGGYRTFDREPAGAEPLGGIAANQPGQPQGWLPYFSVASMDHALATVEQAGGKIVTAAMQTPYGRLAAIADPWGVPCWIKG